MSRTPAQVVAALAGAAELTGFDGSRTWRDVLFGPDDTLDPTGPDRALLLALADEYAALDDHLDTLPAAAHRAWLTEILGVPRLPVVPDRVVAHVTVDPKLAPAVVARGTLLRGGKDAFGNERRYTTLDALTAHGAALAGVRSLAPGGTSAGLPGVAGSAPGFPLDPLDGPDAPHVLRISSPALAFVGGDLQAALTFDGATGESGLTGAGWRYSRADGSVSPAPAAVTGATVRLSLSGDCGSPDGDPWVEWAVPATTPLPEDLGFSRVWVAVVDRTAYVPEGAYYNDGAVDVAKEFQPFGAVAKRGDAFYVRSDEAFTKDVDRLRIAVSELQAGGTTVQPSLAGSGIPIFYMQQISGAVSSALAKLTGPQKAVVQGDFEFLTGLTSSSTAPSVRWQRREDGQWKQFGDPSSRFDGVDEDQVGGSERTVVSGQEGHYVRAFLAQGDFGWTKYQSDVAAFATQAVSAGGPDPVMPVPPSPPIASSITLRYTTRPVPASRVESVSGWRHTVQPAGLTTYLPFRRAVSDEGATGMVALGLVLPESATGSTVSVWFEVDSAAPCGSTDPVDAGWQWWDGAAWQPLPVADGSRQLRESGLLRFVAPRGWEDGCTDVGAPGPGRWIRLVTAAPDRLGTLRSVLVDAVVAEFVSAAADPQTDPSPATALPAGTIKGTLTPIRGVKKVTNPASVRGRGPEAEPAYLARASARTRHRNRALAPWDYEQQVALAFPEVAAVLCLPHTDRDGGHAPGVVGLVVVPDRPDDPAPKPSVSLIGRIGDVLTPLSPVGARIAVLCPRYAAVSVAATIRLRRGVAALTGQEEIRAAIEGALHPTATGAPRWGRSLYASSLVAFLEQQPSVDVVTAFELRDADGVVVEVVEVDPCRGLTCSTGAHALTCEEQL